MGRNKTPQTFEKRRRELDKQMKRKAKIEKRHERSAQKRENKRLGIEPKPIGGESAEPPAQDADPRSGVDQGGGADAERSKPGEDQR